AGLDNKGQILGGWNNYITLGGDFLNTGIIDGENVAVRANNITNINTGSIFGTNLALEARGTLLNGLPLDQTGTGTSGLIASRNRMDLAGYSIINREDGTLYSGGDLFVGGSLNSANMLTGSAAALEYATGESDVLGNIAAEVGGLLNKNQHYKTEQR
ncbi:MAG: hypothetical protein LUD38_15090, partial [Parabacteroides sp.]|nr:hypothetical protein [Parabacteroides sp.]